MTARPSASLGALALIALVALLGACSEAPTVSACLPEINPDCEDDPGEGPPTDEIIAGVNLTALFTPPTATEIAAAQAAFSPRATQADVFLISATPEEDGTRRFLLAFDQGGRRVFSALVRVPGSTAATTPLPVVVLLSDETGGADGASFLTGANYGELENGSVQVAVAYRGETLRIDATAVPSDLDPDPYRADVSDVLAVLDALPLIPRADPARVALYGLGRGGTVALLTAAPGDVDAVVTLGAPTDLFAPSFQGEIRTLLRGRSVKAPYPALDALAAPILALRDGGIDGATARERLLALSPARLRPALPSVFALHAVGDRAVGDDQLEALRVVLTSDPGASRIARTVENTTHDELPTLQQVRGEITFFPPGRAIVPPLSSARSRTRKRFGRTHL